MKKLLALVLALVMTLSLAVVGSNAAFKDADKVNETYAEAVDVLAGMKVFQGYTDGSFQPEGSITRAEVAAIVYRLYTGDVADKQASLYASYNKFNDMNGAAWAKGYIGYCANAGLVKGYDAKTFAPQDKVTGYQALAMILRAVGYDKNGEFVGADWQLHVAQTAQQLGVLKNVKGEDLNAAASRQLVAELLFQTAANVPMVNYTAALGYTNLDSILNGKTNATLGYKNFGLTCDKTYGDDAWGRPAYVWYGEFSGNNVYNKNTKDVVYAVIKEAPIATYKVATAECQIASDAGFKADKTFTLYVNGVKSTDVVQPTDTVGKLGAQGRLMEVYSDRIVMIDTFLAVVTKVVDASYDAAGHRIAPSSITLAVYDSTKAAPSTYVMYNGEENYTYAVGDYLLLNAYTDRGDRTTSGVVTKELRTDVGVYGEIVGKADSVVGTQTVIWYNTGKHTVNGTTYDDAMKFILDNAVDQTNQYTWFFDSYGNIIGNVEVATQYNYAVLTKLWWNNIGAEGTGHAMGTLKYMDGTENTVTVAAINDYTTTYAVNNNYGMDATTKTFSVATYPGTNDVNDGEGVGTTNFINDHLFKVATMADGSVSLTEVPQIVSSYIVNKYAYIIDANKQHDIKIDSETVFMVRSGSLAAGYTYTKYTGMNELPSFKTGAVVDYVEVNGIAKYVFIIGKTVDSTNKNFVLTLDKAYSAVLKTVGGVQYYEVTLPVPAEDGSVVTLKVKVADKKAVLDDQLLNLNNVGRLFYVTYTNGYAVKAEPITTSVFTYSADGRAIKLEKSATYLNNVIEANGLRFNVTNATTVVGKLAADMTKQDVYVIYNKDNLNAEKVYVLDYSIEQPTPSSDWTVTAHGFAVNSKTMTVKVPSEYTTFAQLNTEFNGTSVGTYYTTVDGIQKLVVVSDANTTVASVLNQVNASVVLTVSSGAYTGTWTVTK